jgi:hypothetical protein
VGLAEVVAGSAKPTADVTPLPQVVLAKDQLAKYHPDATTNVSKLPPLVPDNEPLKDSKFLHRLGNIDGL